MRSTRLPWLLLSPTLIILIITGLLPFFYVLYVGCGLVLLVVALVFGCSILFGTNWFQASF